MAEDTGVAGAFDAQPKGNGAAETVPGHEGTVDLQGGAPQESAWQKAYSGHADLRDFARQRGDDPTAWEYDYDKVAKTLKDRLSHVGKLEATIASLRGQGDDQLTVPATVEDYLNGFDHEALKAKAARAYLGRPEKGSNPTELAFFQSMYDQGIPVEKAREAFSTFMVGINEHIAVPKTQQERLEEAVKGLGSNGRQQLAEVNEWLQSEDARDPMDADTKALISQVMRTRQGLAWLWRQSRRTAAGMPPAAPTAEKMTQDEVHEAMTSERYGRDRAYRERILAASRLLHPKSEGTDGWSGRITL